ncbi:divergent polysaccharide deacetylase family protein [Campylobacter vicugnae]|uniref:divergent polysaccharide deacetylase family protein n=1 Tax=Campylobacter vicugnae TaxID=1660076 RepID=UPI000A347D8E|nr:divergent polysaccharide deacetylase family protein [Campylobacter sp. S0112]
MAKHKKSSTPNSSGVLVYLGILLSILAIVAIIYIVVSNKKDQEQVFDTQTINNIDTYFKDRKREYSILDTPKNVEQNITDTKLNSINESDINKSKNDIDKPNMKIKEPNLNLKPNHDIKTDLNLSSNRPKLAIILDDISTFYHAKKIKSLDMNITPSIFPPSKNYPNSVNVAKEFKFYMIHLPLEAINYQAQEKNTLKINDSSVKIESQIANIKSNFPTAIYINNHTGSKFTSDYNAMKRLFKALKKNNMIFIDSYTTKDSKAKILSQEFGNKYLKRDVFIDNIKDEKAIIKELKRSIKVAKTNGLAIAIGHPYQQTFKALAAMKNELANETELVILKDMYELYN